MIETLEQLLDLVENNSLREHRFQNLELKEDWQQTHGKKISGLSNKRLSKSWMVIGVSDHGEIAKKNEKWARGTEEIISQQINSNLNPVFAVEAIHCRSVKNGEYWIIAIEITFPEVIVNWQNKAYKASGTTCEEMNSIETLEFIIQHPGKFDITAKPANFEASEKLVASFIDRLSKVRPDPDLTSLGSKSASEVLKELNISGKQTSRILFGNCKVRVVFYDSYENVVTNDTVIGAYQILEDHLIQKIQDHARQYNGLTDSFPANALKEAIANSVAHAAYFESDGEITLEIYPSRISISNLCLNDSEIFANKWFSRSHRTVNNLLMETLRLSKHVDELGRGKGIIFRDSLLKGKQPPVVQIESAGRYARWRLYIYGGTTNERQERLLERLREYFQGDINKALIANALIFWSDKPVSSITPYIDGDSLKAFADVLSDLKGPIFYWKERDQIVLRRWVKVLLTDGADSKSLTPAEEEDLLQRAYKFQSQFGKGLISPKDLRDLAQMGTTASERTLSTNLLKKWESKGAVIKVRNGLYQFQNKHFAASDYQHIIKVLEALNRNKESGQS
ncbi:helix-turn-helix domain-containing protein [Bdellovibrio bacteriovorus]|uniref:AlbA family DNA-binding domain-containing protein n=1 Tax=Bdellovibrio bacteriovorus TaxID=959 RepID=UPI003A7FD43B